MNPSSKAKSCLAGQMPKGKCRSDGAVWEQPLKHCQRLIRCVGGNRLGLQSSWLLGQALCFADTLLSAAIPGLNPEDFRCTASVLPIWQLRGVSFQALTCPQRREFSWRVTHTFPEQLFVFSLELSWCCPHFNPAVPAAGKGMGLGQLRAVSA